ncbi:MAG: hypothetical protein IJX98_01320 [Clostridia bacterium]|nr:hypothetical protein [Clostridia bacterium]
MKAHYQSYRYGGEICKAEGQSIVECRIAGQEIANIVAVQARAAEQNATCENGEIKYSGKLYLTVLYEDLNGKICRLERGAEFFHNAKNEAITPACIAQGTLSVDNSSVRREGANYIVSCVIGARFCAYGEKQISYLSGGEGLIVKRTELPISSVVCVSGVFEEEDEFETDFAQDILMHGETVTVTDVRCEVGQVEISGEIGLHFCMLRRDGSLCSYERTAPFRSQLVCDMALPSSFATASVSVQTAYISADTDEEKGRSKIVVTFTLQACAKVYETTELTVCEDAYALDRNTSLKWQNEAGRVALNARTITERVHGTPVLSSAEIQDKMLRAVIMPTASCEAVKTENGLAIEGVVEGKAIFSGEDGGYVAADLSLPFILPLTGGETDAEINCSVYGLSLRIRGGEAEAEATLKLRVCAYGSTQGEYLSEVIEGDEKPVIDSAVSVYILGKGDGLWETAKRLSLSPEEVERSNPTLDFPLKGEERLVIYRQKP